MDWKKVQLVCARIVFGIGCIPAIILALGVVILGVLALACLIPGLLISPSRNWNWDKLRNKEDEDDTGNNDVSK